MSTEPDPDVTPDAADDPDGPTRLPWVAGAVVIAFLIVVGVMGLLTSGDDEPAQDAATDSLPPVATDGGLGEFEDAPEMLPPAELGDFGGDGVTQVTDLLGEEPLIINFWATWCAPCVAEMPDLQMLADAAGEDLRLVGINTQDSPLNAEPFAEDLGITYQLLTDPQGDYFTANNSFGMPTTLFVSPDGGIRWRQTGPMTLEQMAELTAEHLGVDVQV